MQTLDKITAQRLPTPLLKIALEDNLQSSSEAWQAWLASGSREDISDRMPRIEVPVVVLAGAKDSGMTPELLQCEVVDRLPDARLIVVPDAAHLLPLEAPQIVADSIRDATVMAAAT
jgi:pimeloyl-ACP methyl ester carboxylesterase